MTDPKQQRRWTVAAATANWIDLDVSLGKARIFAIYEVEEHGSAKLLEHRVLSKDEHLQFFSPARLSPFFDGIDIVLVKEAGQGAIRSLERAGTRVFIQSGRIAKALTALASRAHLLVKMGPGSVQRSDVPACQFPDLTATQNTLLATGLFGQVSWGVA